MDTYTSVSDFNQASTKNSQRTLEHRTKQIYVKESLSSQIFTMIRPQTDEIQPLTERHNIDQSPLVPKQFQMPTVENGFAPITKNDYLKYKILQQSQQRRHNMLMFDKR